METKDSKEPRLINSLYRMYLNIIRFMEYRQYNAKTRQMTEDAFLKQLHLHEYALIDAVGMPESRIPNRNIFIFLVDESSEYGSAANKFEMLEYFIKKKKKEEVDVIVIAKSKPSIHLRKKIALMKKRKTNVYMYEYDNFKSVVPESPQVPKHEIAARAEDTDAIKTILTDEKISDINQMPKIFESDIVAIWHGIKAGDVVKITGVSESAGERMLYRLCI